MRPRWFSSTPPSAPLLNAFELQDELRYSFYDSQALAAALQAGASKLYTEDLQALATGARHAAHRQPFCGCGACIGGAADSTMSRVC